MGVLSRENLANSLPISAGFGSVLQILVENLGRINFDVLDDFKGIIGDVRLNANDTLENWNITGFPFENATQIDELLAFINQQTNTNVADDRYSEHLQSGPMIFHGTFDIEQQEIVDTYINPIEWGKVGSR